MITMETPKTQFVVGDIVKYVWKTHPMEYEYYGVVYLHSDKEFFVYDFRINEYGRPVHTLDNDINLYKAYTEDAIMNFEYTEIIQTLECGYRRARIRPNGNIRKALEIARERIK